MQVDFENIFEHRIPMEDFRLKWRFTDDIYDKLPSDHLKLLQPLDIEASKYLWDYISATNLHQEKPFKKGFFRIIDKAKITGENKREVKKWLYQRGLPFDKFIFLSWEPTTAMIIPWKLLINTLIVFIIAMRMTWALLFYHEDEIYFGTNKSFKPSEAFTNKDFIW